VMRAEKIILVLACAQPQSDLLILLSFLQVGVPGAGGGLAGGEDGLLSEEEIRLMHFLQQQQAAFEVEDICMGDFAAG